MEVLTPQQVTFVLVSLWCANTPTFREASPKNKKKHCPTPDFPLRKTFINTTFICDESRINVNILTHIVIFLRQIFPSPKPGVSYQTT